ncbi:MAG: D-beta-D-heptose 1-phosphate adenosyltransferase, partial [Thermoleophilaceae bacterium]|nr:D-beta-D-heptose 1-phosphate adenosyltransferase [Thermoleophilaceae bacterium]
MSGTRLIVVGDALLDRDVEGGVERLAPDAPVPVVAQRSERVRPGGAGLAAALAAADGRDVLLVAALGHDRAAGELRAALARAGVDVLDLGLRGPTPEKVRVIGAGRHMLRIDRGGRDGGEVGPPGAELRAALADACGVLVSDYGRGVTSAPGVRAALAETGERRPLVWDPHPRGAPPVAGAWLATPNAAEAAGFAPAVAGEGVAAAVRRARVLARAWRARAVCVTLGADGAVLAGEGAGATLLPAP